MMFGKRFDAAEAEMHEGLQKEFSERFLFLPMKTRANYPTVPDPERSSCDVHGTFSWDSHDTDLKLKEVRVSSRRPKIAFHKHQLRGLKLQRGDQLTRYKDDTVFEVSEKKPDSLSGVEFFLIQLGVSP